MAAATATTTAVMPPPHMSAPDTKAAMMAAATCGPPKDKHRPAPFKDLKTPLSAHTPIQSPLATSTPTWMKREGNMKTPVTPPSAYLDFLKAMSPGMPSPLSTGASTHFSFTAGAPSPALAGPTPKSASFPAPPYSARPTLSSQPSNTSTASASTASSIASSASLESADTTMSAPAAAANNAANSSRRVERILPVLPSPGLPPRPASAATTTGHFPTPTSSRPGPPPRRPSLIIPESPSSSTFSPATLSGSYTPISAIRSPAPPKSAISPVVVRHVVTRTVTYTRRMPPSSAHPRTATAAAATTASESPAPAAASSSSEGKERARAQSQPLVGEAPRGKKRRVD